MKDIFIALLIFSLSFIVPPYVVFIFVILYILALSKPVWIILIFAVYLDLAYGFNFSVYGVSIPLYSALGVVGFFTLPFISRRLSI